MSEREVEGQRRRCFLSYSLEHREHAEFLKEETMAACGDAVEVFTFSDPSNLAPGEPWYTKLISTLRETNVLLLLLSPSSVNRPWLLFESGSAVALGTKIIPLRFCGLPASFVPGPLAPFQSCNLNERDAVIQMLADLASSGIPQKANLFKSARRIVEYFENVQKEQVEVATKERPLLSPNNRLAMLCKFSETQRRLFLHVRTWEDSENRKGVLESDIRAALPIAYKRHGNVSGHRKLVISPSEYYFRLRELFHLGLLEMEKVSDFENRWSLNPEIRQILK